MKNNKRKIVASVAIAVFCKMALLAAAANTNEVTYVRVADIPKERITRVVVKKDWPIIVRWVEFTTNTISATVIVRSSNRWEKTYKYSGLSAAIDKLCRGGLQKTSEPEGALPCGGFTESIGVYIGERLVFSGYLYHLGSDSTCGNLKCNGKFLPEIEPTWLDVALTDVEEKMCNR